MGDFDNRARSVIYGATAALPPALRKPFSARLDQKAVARLKKLLVAWMRAARLDDATFAERFFGRDGADPVVAKLRSAVQRADLATRHSELGEAAADLAAAIQLVGLDLWSRFVEDAEQRADDPATIAAVEKSRQPPAPGKDAIRPVYPIENLLGLGAAGTGGRSAARAGGRFVLGRLIMGAASQDDSKVESNGPAQPDGVASPARSLLPNGGGAKIDPRKLIAYALDPNHPSGGDKARVFQAALGFTREDVGELLAQIRSGILKNPAKRGLTDQHGTRFTVDMPITGPKGTVIVRTGWIIDTGKLFPRLVTAYVK